MRVRPILNSTDCRLMRWQRAHLQDNYLETHFERFNLFCSNVNDKQHKKRKGFDKEIVQCTQTLHVPLLAWKSSLKWISWVRDDKIRGKKKVEITEWHFDFVHVFAVLDCNSRYQNLASVGMEFWLSENTCRKSSRRTHSACRLYLGQSELKVVMTYFNISQLNDCWKQWRNRMIR